MESEVGGGIGMGNTCKPMDVSFQCMTKSTTIKKKKTIIIAKTPLPIIDGKPKENIKKKRDLKDSTY